MNKNRAGQAAEKALDHVTLGRVLDLFYHHKAVGRGLPLLTPRGTTIKQVLVRFVEDEEQRRGYLHTSTPVLAGEKLYALSGHLEHFRKNMFILPAKQGGYSLALRPMTCPHQFVLYKRKQHSYRDLPIRYAETATLFRNEASGTMYGLMRIRQFTLSDGHIICRADQVETEFLGCIDLVNYILRTLGLNDYRYRFSQWDPGNKSKYIDNPRAWEESQALLKKIVEAAGISYYEAPGEAAFYGPKLDIQMKNSWGKEETVFTIQLDFALAERFAMHYTDENGEMKRPLIIHRSALGCYERTLAMLIERYQGRFPFWLAPEQLRIIPVSEIFTGYAHTVRDQLVGCGLRACTDSRNETLQKRILNARREYVPVVIVVGKREQAAETASIRLPDGTLIPDIPLLTLKEQARRLSAERLPDVVFY